jgi:type IV pilus assembly protein PilM
MPDIIPETSFVGIDIGSSWIKAVELRRGLGGYNIAKLARKEINLPENETAEDRQKATIAAILALLKENGISSHNVVVGLPGYQIFVRKLRLPAASDDRLRKIILYEARQQIPFPIDKIQIDYHVKKIPDSNEVEVLLVGSKKEIVADYMGFIRKSGLKLKYLDVSPVALYNFQRHVDAILDQEATAMINIGAATTDISICREGILSFTRTAPVGGNDLTKNISKALKVDFKQAETLKLQHGRIPLEYELELGIEDTEGGTPEEKATRQSIISGLDRIVNEIRRTFDYYISQPDGVAISRIVISGGTSLLPNLDGYLSEKLAIPVTLVTKLTEWDKMKDIVEKYGDDIIWCTNAIGLALHGASRIPKLIRVDFLPEELQDIRNFKEKRLQISIATALLLLVVFMGSQFGSDEVSIKKQQAADLQNKSLSVKRGYDNYEALMKKKDSLSKVYTDLQMVLGKRDYWLGILSQISQNAPKDIWFSRIQGSPDYVEKEDQSSQGGFGITSLFSGSNKNPDWMLILDGKSASEGAVKEFADKIGTLPFVRHDKDGKAMVKPTHISSPAMDSKAGKMVTSFTFEITLNPPKAAEPK